MRLTLKGLIPLAAMAFAASAGAVDAPLEQHLASLNQEVARIAAARSSPEKRMAQSAAPDPVRIIAERSAALAQLIEESPARAFSHALPEQALASLRTAFPQAAASLEERGSWSGEITELYRDYRDRSVRVLWLRHGGKDLELHFAYGETGRLRTGDRARVFGLRLGTHVAVNAANSTGPSAAPTCSSQGEQRIAVLMTTFPGVHPPDYSLNAMRSMFFGSGLSLNGYWSEASYGKTTASGDVYGWFELDRAYRCSEMIDIRTAALAAARANSVDLSGYNRIYIYFPYSSTCGGLLGQGTLGCESSGFSSALMPVQGSLDTLSHLPVVAHEGGHNLGLEEVTGRDYGAEALGPAFDVGVRTTYYDPFTAMGNFNEYLGHYNSRQKWQLGWLTDSDIATVTEPGSSHLAPLSGDSNSPRAVRVRRPDSDGWLWLEYRPPTGLYESRLPPLASSGALIHYEDHWNADTSLKGPTDLLDFTPRSSSDARKDFLDAPLAASSTWADPWTPLTLDVGAVDAAGLQVTVRHESCVTSVTSSRPHGSGTESGTIEFAAAPDCQWTARATASWITPSASAGSGGGTLTYTVAANNQPSERVGAIAVGRRSVRIAQAGTDAPPTAVTVAPDLGAGYAQVFTEVFTDPDGTADIARVMTVFAHSDQTRNCQIALTPDDGTIMLMAEDRTYSMGLAGSGDVLENAHCSLSLSGVSYNSVGNELYVRLPMVFKTEFGGEALIVGMARDRHAGTGVSIAGTVLGHWNVGALAGAAPTVSVEGVVNGASFTGGPVAPGEIVTLFGTGLGPSEIAYAYYDGSGYLGNYAGNTRVFFDDVQAPLIYSLGLQVSAIVPYGVSGTTRMRVEFEGRSSSEVLLPVTAAAPGIFRYGGQAQGVIVNEDGSFNSVSKPAPRGSIVTFFATGEGQTVPAGITGTLPKNGIWPEPAGPLTVTFGGVPGHVEFKGLVYAGVLQVNVTVPNDAPAGSAVPLVVNVAGVSSPSGTTIAIQ